MRLGFPKTKDSMTPGDCPRCKGLGVCTSAEGVEVCKTCEGTGDIIKRKPTFEEEFGEPDDYDYAADDFAFDAAREKGR